MQSFFANSQLLDCAKAEGWGFVKIGHAIRVLQSDLDDFIQRHRIGTPP